MPHTPREPASPLFRILTQEEDDRFRDWARSNYTPFSKISGVWHPTVQDECVRMNTEAAVFPPDPNIPTREPNCTCSDDQLIFVGCDCPRDDKGDVIPHEPVGGDFDDEVLPW